MSDLKIGDVVNYHSIIGGQVTSTDHEIKAIERTPNNFGSDVAWITGKSGCVDLEALSKSQEKQGDCQLVLCERCNKPIDVKDIGKAKIDGEPAHVQCALDEADEIGGCYGNMRKIRQLTRVQQRYQRFLEYGDSFQSFIHFCQWDAEKQHSWNGS